MNDNKVIWQTKKYRLVFYRQFGFNLQVYSSYRKTFVTSGQWAHTVEWFKKENYQ